MLIISQDKTMLLNFENIEAIGVGNPLEDNDGKFQILVETTSDNQYPIAEYGTEERAKEVLKAIKDKYIEYAQISNAIGDIKQVFTMPKAYEMPEE